MWREEKYFMKIAVVSIGSFDTQYSDYHIMRDITVRRISHTKTKSGYASRRVNGCVSREPRKQSFPKRTLSVYSSKSPPGEGNKRTQPHKYLPDWYVVRTVDGQ